MSARISAFLVLLTAIFSVTACSVAPVRHEPLVVRASDAQKLGADEVREVYRHIAEAFPYQSKPIDGVSLLFGEDIRLALSVPALTTPRERMAYCGLLSVSSSEIIGLAHANPFATIPKAWAGICSLITKPNLLVRKEKEESHSTDEGIAFTGDR